jgi:hypothetical protein
LDERNDDNCTELLELPGRTLQTSFKHYADCFRHLILFVGTVRLVLEGDDSTSQSIIALLLSRNDMRPAGSSGDNSSSRLENFSFSIRQIYKLLVH